MEVDFINKQKFLTELGRLLTFMYEEDRQKALSMYTRMFEETEDEQGLIQLLVSPTRQAVVLARTYDAKDRKLQVYSQSRDEYAAPETDEIPPFVLAIDKIARQAEALSDSKITVSEDQFSLFDDTSEEAEPEAEPAEVPWEPEAQPETETEPELYAEPEIPAEIEAELPAEPEKSFEQPEAEEAEPAEEKSEDERIFEDYVSQPAEPLIEEEPPVPEELKKAEADVDAFLADFSIEDKSESEDVTAETEPEDEPVERLPEVRTARKPSIGLLILYIITAIPITLIGIAVLLIPTLLFLSLACAAVYCGIMAFNAAFGGFSVFADKLVLIGAGVGLLALGLLFVWTFIWFLGGAIAGLVRGVFALGRKWCFKEVAEQ